MREGGRERRERTQAQASSRWVEPQDTSRVKVGKLESLLLRRAEWIMYLAPGIQVPGQHLHPIVDYLQGILPYILTFKYLTLKTKYFDFSIHFII